MFNREEHLVQDSNGDKWINIPALLEVLSAVNVEVQRIALAKNTVHARSAAGVIAEYTSDLRLTLMRL